MTRRVPAPRKTHVSAQKQRVIGDIFLSELTLPALAAKPSAPAYLGDALRGLDQDAPQAIGGLGADMRVLGLRGPRGMMARAAVDYLADNPDISTEEVWEKTDFSLIEAEDTLENTLTPRWRVPYIDSWQASVDNTVSLAEKERGIVGRSSLRLQVQTSSFLGFLAAGSGVRLNLGDNLESLAQNRAQVASPVRSDLQEYTARHVGLDSAYLAYSRTPMKNFHVLGMSGYLEETHAGSGFEALYRPFEGRFALGAEGWALSKRAPETTLSLGLRRETQASFLVNAWYSWPREAITAQFSAGRFLAGDVGASLALETTLTAGVRLGGFVTLTDIQDVDAAGERLGAMHGVSLRVPLGGLPLMPENAIIRTRAEPLLRDVGQRVEPPLRLYEMTESFSLAAIDRDWSEIKAPVDKISYNSVGKKRLPQK